MSSYKTTEEERRGSIPGSTQATAMALASCRACANPTVERGKSKSEKKNGEKREKKEISDKTTENNGDDKTEKSKTSKVIIKSNAFFAAVIIMLLTPAGSVTTGCNELFEDTGESVTVEVASYIAYYGKENGHGINHQIKRSDGFTHYGFRIRLEWTGLVHIYLSCVNIAENSVSFYVLDGNTIDPGSYFLKITEDYIYLDFDSSRTSECSTSQPSITFGINYVSDGRLVSMNQVYEKWKGTLPRYLSMSNTLETYNFFLVYGNDNPVDLMTVQDENNPKSALLTTDANSIKCWSNCVSEDLDVVQYNAGYNAECIFHNFGETIYTMTVLPRVVIEHTIQSAKGTMTDNGYSICMTFSEDVEDVSVIMDDLSKPEVDGSNCFQTSACFYMSYVTSTYDKTVTEVLPDVDFQFTCDLCDCTAKEGDDVFVIRGEKTDLGCEIFKVSGCDRHINYKGADLVGSCCNDESTLNPAKTTKSVSNGSSLLPTAKTIKPTGMTPLPTSSSGVSHKGMLISIISFIVSLFSHASAGFYNEGTLMCENNGNISCVSESIRQLSINGSTELIQYHTRGSTLRVSCMLNGGNGIIYGSRQIKMTDRVLNGKLISSRVINIRAREMKIKCSNHLYSEDIEIRIRDKVGRGKRSAEHSGSECITNDDEPDDKKFNWDDTMKRMNSEAVKVDENCKDRRDSDYLNLKRNLIKRHKRSLNPQMSERLAEELNDVCKLNIEKNYEFCGILMMEGVNGLLLNYFNSKGTDTSSGTIRESSCEFMLSLALTVTAFYIMNPYFSVGVFIYHMISIANGNIPITSETGGLCLLRGMAFEGDEQTEIQMGNLVFNKMEFLLSDLYTACVEKAQELGCDETCSILRDSINSGDVYQEDDIVSLITQSSGTAYTFRTKRGLECYVPFLSFITQATHLSHCESDTNGLKKAFNSLDKKVDTNRGEININRDAINKMMGGLKLMYNQANLVTNQLTSGINNVGKIVDSESACRILSDYEIQGIQQIDRYISSKNQILSLMLTLMDNPKPIGESCMNLGYSILKAYEIEEEDTYFNITFANLIGYPPKTDTCDSIFECKGLCFNTDETDVKVDDHYIFKGKHVSANLLGNGIYRVSESPMGVQTSICTDKEVFNAKLKYDGSGVLVSIGNKTERHQILAIDDRNFRAEPTLKEPKFFQSLKNLSGIYDSTYLTAFMKKNNEEFDNNTKEYVKEDKEYKDAVNDLKGGTGFHWYTYLVIFVVCAVIDIPMTMLVFFCCLRGTSAYNASHAAECQVLRTSVSTSITTALTMVLICIVIYKHVKNSGKYRQFITLMTAGAMTTQMDGVVAVKFSECETGTIGYVDVVSFIGLVLAAIWLVIQYSAQRNDDRMIHNFMLAINKNKESLAAGVAAYNIPTAKGAPVGRFEGVQYSLDAVMIIMIMVILALKFRKEGTMSFMKLFGLKKKSCGELIHEGIDDTKLNRSFYWLCVSVKCSISSGEVNYFIIIGTVQKEINENVIKDILMSRLTVVKGMKSELVLSFEENLNSSVEWDKRLHNLKSYKRFIFCKRSDESKSCTFSVPDNIRSVIDFDFIVRGSECEYKVCESKLMTRRKRDMSKGNDLLIEKMSAEVSSSDGVADFRNPRMGSMMSKLCDEDRCVWNRVETSSFD